MSKIKPSDLERMNLNSPLAESIKRFAFKDIPQEIEDIKAFTNYEFRYPTSTLLAYDILNFIYHKRGATLTMTTYEELLDYEEQIKQSVFTQ